MADIVDSNIVTPHARRRTAVGVGAFLVAIILGGAFFYGRGACAASDGALAAAIEEESRAFCVSLGVAPAIEAYAHCAEGLANVRRRVEERLAAKAAGAI